MHPVGGSGFPRLPVDGDDHGEQDRWQGEERPDSAHPERGHEPALGPRARESFRWKST